MKIDIKLLYIWLDVIAGVVVSENNCIKRNGSFCTQCLKGYYITNSNCYQCKTSCRTCTSFSNCTSCMKGFYGSSCKHCDKKCETCTNANQCTQCARGYYTVKKSDGRVSCSVCPSEKWGYECEHDCSTNCVNTTCNPSDGKSTYCPYDKYGGTCQYQCTDGCYVVNRTNVCNRETGQCIHGCKLGYDGLKCDYNGTTVDGQWGQWSEFTPCSVTCGTGTTLRSRSCNDPSPQYGGQDCSGNAEESESCNLSNCPDNIGQTGANIGDNGALIKWIAGGLTMLVSFGVTLAVLFICRRARHQGRQDHNANQTSETQGIEIDHVHYEELTERPHQNATYMAVNTTEYENVDEQPLGYSGSQIELQTTEYQNV